jgi:Zn-dependent metalloprotease
MSTSCRCFSCIMPPHLLLKLLESKDAKVKESALATLLATSQLRGERNMAAFMGAVASGDGRRTIFDCHNRDEFSATVVRSEDGPASADGAVNRAFDGLGTTRDFYHEVLDRNSIDGNGMRLDGYVHYEDEFNNAFWDGRRMIFGDGDNRRFTDFTKSLDVIAHELTHGVTEFTAGLTYHNQPGALNESMSDVFGSLVKQWSLGQTADQADWLIGAEVFTPDVDADALRSMKAPGTAYDNEEFGRDPQPDHMSRFASLPDTRLGDWGGVHINSGIPNKAFYLTATTLGGHAWDAPGHIWYEALRASNVDTQFQEFADTTYAKADQLYGAASAEQQAVAAAWRDVGIRITGASVASAPRRGVMATKARARAPGWEEDSLAEMKKQIAALTAQVKSLTKEVGTKRRG